MNYNDEAIVKLHRSCPLCNSQNLKPEFYEKNSFPSGIHPEVSIFNNTWINLLKCQDCSFAFTQQTPASPTFFANRYDNKWFNPEFETGSTRKSEILDDLFLTLDKLGYRDGELLDIGSFAGKLLLKANSCGFKVSGVEINPKLASYTKEKLGFEVICSEFQKLQLEQNKYRVITIIDVLEHLVDPLTVLQNLSNGLAKNGILVIKVPNYPMQKLKQKIAHILGISKEGVFANFAHINHFNVESMEKVLSKSGLKIIRIGVAPSEKWDETKFINRIKNIIRESYFQITQKINIKLGLNISYYAIKE